METKGITCKIPLELHNRISEEIRREESTMSRFIEKVINHYYEKGSVNMSNTRTMAFQISEELFQKIKAYLLRFEEIYGRRLTQKEFVIGLIENVLSEVEEEFEAAPAARQEAQEEAEMAADESGCEALCEAETDEAEEQPAEEETDSYSGI